MELRVGGIRVVIDDEDVNGEDPVRLLIRVAALLMRASAEYDLDGDDDAFDAGDATDT